MLSATRLLSSKDVATVVSHLGRSCFMAALVERLSAALRCDNQDRVSLARSGFAYNHPKTGAQGLLEWMPAMDVGPSRVVGVKAVGYHPANPVGHNIPSVLATTSVYDPETGGLNAIVDATLLTAMRTGAMAAIATDLLAPLGPITVGLIGCGTQAVTQLQAMTLVRPVEQVLAFDVQPQVALSLQSRVRFLDRRIDTQPLTNGTSMLNQIDVLCTATTVEPGAGPVVMDGEHRPWLHINAMGSDFPGKRELPQSLIERALVVPDTREQCIAEGECQYLDPELIGPELGDLAKNEAAWSHAKGSLTVFDSTGWSVADLVAAELVLEHAMVLGIGQSVRLQTWAGDPYDPYQGLAG
jgi:L-lysine cyclodeaminase